MKKQKINIIVLIIGISCFLLLTLSLLFYNPSKVNRNAKIEDITINSEKINVYVFWGKGCPVCEELLDYLESIQDKYGKYHTVYGLEIWNNDENREFMDKILEQLNESNPKRSVPVYIIGNKVFYSYNSSNNGKIKKTIISEYENKDNLLKFENIIK